MPLAACGKHVCRKQMGAQPDPAILMVRQSVRGRAGAAGWGPTSGALRPKHTANLSGHRVPMKAQAAQTISANSRRWATLQCCVNAVYLPTLIGLASEAGARSETVPLPGA